MKPTVSSGLPRRDFITARNDTVFNILKLFDYIYKEYDFKSNLTAEQKAIADELVKANKVNMDCVAKNFGKAMGGDMTVCKTEADNYMQIYKKACFADIFTDECKSEFQE